MNCKSNGLCVFLLATISLLASFNPAFSQIAFKGKYMNGNGWTNGSFVGMVTKEDLKYIVVIQVRRPRTTQYGEYTAGRLFGDLAKFLIERELIAK